VSADERAAARHPQRPQGPRVRAAFCPGSSWTRCPTASRRRRGRRELRGHALIKARRAARATGRAASRTTRASRPRRSAARPGSAAPATPAGRERRREPAPRSARRSRPGARFGTCA
jgi:hypothetical protein